MDCYIYYKSACSQREKIIFAVTKLQVLLRGTLQLEMHLQRRPLASSDVDTWMEIYRDIPSTSATEFAELIQPLVLQCGLTPYLLGERHSELFIDMVRSERDT